MSNTRLRTAFDVVKDLSPSMRAEVAKLIKCGATDEEWRDVATATECPGGAKAALARMRRDRKMARKETK